MPTVPSLEAPQVQEEALPGRPNPRIDDNVSSAAFGAPLAEGLENVSSAVTEEEAKQKTQNDQLRVIDANTQLEAGRNALLYGKPGQDGTMQGGAFSFHGMDALNLPDKLTPAYQGMADKISSTLTPDQQRLFQPHIAAGSNELNLQLNRYEYEESNRLANNVYTNGANQAVESASVGWRDPIVIGKSRADIKALVQLQGDREGWGQDEKNAQTQKLLAEMHYSVVDRMLADGNPQAALSYFVGSKADPGIRDTNELTGEQAHQLGSAIDAAVRQQGAQNQAAVAAKVQDVRAAAINGQLVPPSSMPSDGELRSAYPDTWQTVKGGIQRDIQMGSDLKSFAGLSPQEITQHVEGYKPSSVLGAAEGYERFNAAAQAAQRTLADRAKDPRQYAIDNQLGSTALNFGDSQGVGDELRARIAAAPALTKQIGGYVPLLSRNESAQLSQSLESMTPTDRLKALNGLNSSINDDRGFQELMRQTMPGSPVTAIVGSSVSASNPHEAPVWFDHRFAQDPVDQARILQGEQLLNPQGLEKDDAGSKKPFPMPTDGGPSGLREQFSQKAGDLFRTRPELGEAYYQTFKSAYAALLSEKGDLSGNGDSKLQKQAMQIAVGNVTSFHNGNISVPQGMDPSRFEGLLDKAVANRAAQAGAPDGWADKISGYGLREIGGLGSGRYELVNGNAPLVRPDGKGLFEVDVNQQFLPSRGAQGSPQDQSRAPAPAAPQADSIEGQPRLSRPTPEAHAIKAPPLGAGGRGGGRAHPSEGPEL